MATATTTSTHTIAQTATYLSEAILGSISDVLGHLNIDATGLSRDWEQDQAAISAWIAEQSLKAVILECHRPDGTVAPVFEFPVTYEAGGEADEAFVNSKATMAKYLAKVSSVPSGCTYKLFCTHNGPRTPQPGWSPGTRASTEGLTSTSFGGLAQGPHARSTMRYLS